MNTPTIDDHIADDHTTDDRGVPTGPSRRWLAIAGAAAAVAVLAVGAIALTGGGDDEPSMVREPPAESPTLHLPDEHMCHEDGTGCATLTNCTSRQTEFCAHSCVSWAGQLKPKP